MKTAYFSMEFAIDQALKIYSGGLGFLAGSHLRSAHELGLDLTGIGLLWKYGYYDQVKNKEGDMGASLVPKDYSYLEDTGIVFPISIHGNQVMVKAYYLAPDVFGSAPLYLLSTDLPENDYLSRTITHRLYDPNDATRVAQSIVLGAGGCKLLQLLNLDIDTYHLNEAHALPAVFWLRKELGNWENVRSKVIFTTHTPERAGNETRPISLLREMNFFSQLKWEEMESGISHYNGMLDYSLTALNVARKTNGVSKIHAEVTHDMWNYHPKAKDVIPITNAQNVAYWQDTVMGKASADNDTLLARQRKLEMKKELFKEVADQTGDILDPNVLTVVWARRFAGYKRANLLLKSFERFKDLVSQANYPIQIIWAGKPYPEDHEGIHIFNDLIRQTRQFANCTVLTGYELELSRKLKCGSDIWLNTPRYSREASGTSGMAAAMNGSINLSLMDGWYPEFVEEDKNGFVIPTSKAEDVEVKDREDYESLMTVLQDKVLPMYYENPDAWDSIVMKGMEDVVRDFSSHRMVSEYRDLMYTAKEALVEA